MKMHGGDLYGVAAQLGISPHQLTDFSANINPLGIPPAVSAAMTESLGRLNHYPDPDSADIIAAISNRYQVPQEFVMVGNGAADLIYRLIYAIKPKTALLTAPTFLEYQEALQQAGSKISYHRLTASAGFELSEQILEEMTAELDLMFLCNPNNPTGLLIGRPLLEQILKKAARLKILVVVDECFLDFTGKENEQSLIGELKEYPNLIILKSITKMFAVPGIRFGYGFSSDLKLIHQINQAGQSWPVNLVAEAAAIAAMNESEFVKESIDYIRTERDYLAKELHHSGFYVYPGTANYLMIQSQRITGLYEKMLHRHIIIRRCCNYEGLDERFYRIAVKSADENRVFCQQLKEMIKSEGDQL